MKVKLFDWDKHNAQKCQKHGLTIPEIETFFFLDPFFCEDPRHSDVEDRYLAFGSFKSKHVLCVFTFRVVHGQICIRVISARFARKKEIEARYEKAKNT